MPNDYKVELSSINPLPQSLRVVADSKEKLDAMHWAFSNMGKGDLAGSDRIKSRTQADAGFISRIFSPLQEHYIELNLTKPDDFKAAQSFFKENQSYIDVKIASNPDVQPAKELVEKLSGVRYIVSKSGDNFVIELAKNDETFPSQNWLKSIKIKDGKGTINKSDMSVFHRECGDRQIHMSEDAKQALQSSTLKP